MKFVMLLTMSIVVLSGSFAACSHVKAKPAVQTVIDDRTIVADISGKIAKDPELTLSKIKVDCDKGKVVLSGRVWNKQGELRAMRTAEGAAGVVSVRSDLVITNETGQPGAPGVK
jgi:osmotically-inducible protein OsmY